MSTKELIEKAATQVISFFEKATEMRFFLHFLCVALYLELGVSFALKKSIFLLTWTEVEHLSLGVVFTFVIGYFALMGYIFRLLFAVLSFCLRGLNIIHMSSTGVRWSDVKGMVHEREIIRRAYGSKDYELTRQLDAHKEACKQDRKETRELAYLSFAALIIIALSKWLISGGILDEAAVFVGALLSEKTAYTLGVLLLLPMGGLIWFDAAEDCSHDEYLMHEPIFLEVEEEKRIERERRGY